MALGPSFSSHFRRRKRENSMPLDLIGDVHPNQNGMLDINNWSNSSKVPRDYADNPSLGLWCVTQRKRKRHKDRMKDHTRNNNTNSNINANRSLELGVEGVEDEDEEDVLVTPGKKPSAMTDEQETKLLMLGMRLLTLQPQRGKRRNGNKQSCRGLLRHQRITSQVLSISW
eukprot:scaffold24460_cov157-Cylindrotheca_fusiformis.AAC.1